MLTTTVTGLQKLYSRLTQKQQRRIADRCQENGIDLLPLLETQS